VGRLFWKFFLCIFLAQLTATVGIGGTIWLQNRARMHASGPVIDSSPPAQMALDSAAATLKFGGTGALRGLLANMQRHRLFAVDELGRELLGRQVEPAMLAQARAILQQGARQHVVREMNAVDGHRYLLFLPSIGHQHDGPPPGRKFHPLVPLAAAILVSLLFAALLAWYFSRPIRDLRLAFEAASGGDLAPRFPDARRGDELSDLRRDFDRMTGLLRSLLDAQTRLLHDVSHELRSPLARMQAAIGLAQQQPDKATTWLARIERESVRMDKLVDQLLTLARLEAGALNAGHEEISMADLIDALVEDARFEAAAQQCRIELVGEADVRVIGQAELLARAIENVVRNAIKYSPVGAGVELRVESSAQHWQISVLDCGPGVAACDLEAIFQPFFRAGGESTEGHGLGLAIAQQVFKAHRGSITARNRSAGGLCMTMTLPLAPAS
jgi:two-component system OmpR family sensor kinase